MSWNWKRVWYILNIRKIIRFIAIRSQTTHKALTHQAILRRTQASLKSAQVERVHVRSHLVEIKQVKSSQSNCSSVSFWIFCKLNQNQEGAKRKSEHLPLRIDTPFLTIVMFIRQLAQNIIKVFLTLPSTLCFSTLTTLNLTVFETGLHWPTVTISPTLVLPKAGVKWAGKLWCLFSNLLYFLM